MTDLKQSFDEHGYVTIESFLSKTEVQELQNETKRFIDDVVPTIEATEVYYESSEDSKTLKQVQHLSEHDDYYLKLVKSDKIVKLAEDLLGGEVELKNMQYFNKIAHVGKPTPAHQDGYYFMIQPQEAITMWLSLGHADVDNGAVCYIPGSHRQGMRPHSRTQTLGFSQGISDWSEKDNIDELQMTAKPGDILVHHSLTIHRANANTSERQRPSIGFIFYKKGVKIDEDAHKAYKERLNKDLLAEGKILK